MKIIIITSIRGVSSLCCACDVNAVGVLDKKYKINHMPLCISYIKQRISFLFYFLTFYFFFSPAPAQCRLSAVSSEHPQRPRFTGFTKEREEKEILKKIPIGCRANLKKHEKKIRHDRAWSYHACMLVYVRMWVIFFWCPHADIIHNNVNQRKLFSFPLHFSCPTVSAYCHIPTPFLLCTLNKIYLRNNII